MDEYNPQKVHLHHLRDVYVQNKKQTNKIVSLQALLGYIYVDQTGDGQPGSHHNPAPNFVGWRIKIIQNEMLKYLQNVIIAIIYKLKHSRMIINN